MGKTTKAEQTKLQELAKHLFITDSCSTQKEIASKVGVSERSLSLWVQKFGWAELRKSMLSTKSTQIALLYNQLDALNKEIAEREQKYATSSETDTIIKLSATIKNLETETGIGELVQMGRDLVKFVAFKDFELSKTFTLCIDEFIQNKLN